MKLKKEKCYFNPDFFAVEPVRKTVQFAFGLKKKNIGFGAEQTGPE
jgi:hypothetical protein